MKIYIEDEILQYENKIDEIDNIFEEIDNIISKSSKTLSHLVVDSIDIYEDHYDYFLDNIRVIEEVRVVTLSYEELVNDIFISTIDYTARVLENIEPISNEFYRNPSKESWQGLTDLLGGISWIMNTFTSIDQDMRLRDVVASYEAWNLYAKEVFELGSILGEMEEALESSDNITIADILIYEILPIFEEMEKALLELAKIEVNLHDLN